MPAPASNPLITAGSATLFWQGTSAPCLISDMHGWEDHPQPLTQLEPGLWAITLPLAPNAYLEYAFFEPATARRLPDPLNHRSVNNGVGSRNHYFYMPGAAPTPFAIPPASGLRGRVTRHRLDSRYLTASATRPVQLYHPPAEAPVPLLVVYDGLDYLRRGRLALIVDNLITARRIRPIALAFTQSTGLARTVEYGCSEPTLGWLLERVLPLAAENINILDYEKHPGAHGVLGASMGGLMAVFTALQLPHVFGVAISQAGAFEHWGSDSVPLQMARLLPPPSARFWLDCGALDSLRDCNRRMHALCLEKGWNITYRENGGAHNFTTWRDSCAAALEELYS